MISLLYDADRSVKNVVKEKTHIQNQEAKQKVSICINVIKFKDSIKICTTPGVNFINILRAPFSYESVLPSFYLAL